MNKVFLAGTNGNARGSQYPNWLIDAEPFPRKLASALRNSPDEVRIKAAVKRAVERDLAPRTLIDSIRSGIRDAK